MTSEDTNHDQNFDIRSDLPKTDPDHEDAFGYAPFAKRLAEVIEKTPSPHGLVMAIHGEWGSGKSSILNFVKNYLSKLADNNKPMVIDFNPWWFRDGDDLAGQLLAAFNKELGIKDGKFKKARDLLSEYSDAIGQAATIIDPSGKILTSIFHKFKNKPKSVPQLKKELSDILKDLNQRVIFIIDDIDRLSPNEIREVFKIIKALADFPNVIYLLSFDRRIVSEALSKSLGIDGNEYLEKIIQLQLSLPIISGNKLHNIMIKNIEEILPFNNILKDNSKIKNENHNPLDSAYSPVQEHIYTWLLSYIKKPRDISRVTNSISILYSSVYGEVNLCDFLIIEFIRTFDHDAYELIKNNKKYFITELSEESENINFKEKKKAFHENWLSQFTSQKKENTQKLIESIFPSIKPTEKVDNSPCFSKTNPRIQCKDNFDIYFQFHFPENIIGNLKFKKLIHSDTILMKQELLSYSREKIKEFVEFAYQVKINEADAALNFLTALLDIGDKLIIQDDLNKLAYLFIENYYYITNPIEYYYGPSSAENHIDSANLEDDCCGKFIEVLKTLIQESSSTTLVSRVMYDLRKNLDDAIFPEEPSKKNPRHKHLECLKKNISTLKNAWLDKIYLLKYDEIIRIDHLPVFLKISNQLDLRKKTIEEIRLILESEEQAMFLIEKLVTPYQTVDLDYFNESSDLNLLKSAIENMLRKSNITENQEKAGCFILGKIYTINNNQVENNG